MTELLLWAATTVIGLSVASLAGALLVLRADTERRFRPPLDAIKGRSDERVSAFVHELLGEVAPGPADLLDLDLVLVAQRDGIELAEHRWTTLEQFLADGDFLASRLAATRSLQILERLSSEIVRVARLERGYQGLIAGRDRSIPLALLSILVIFVSVIAYFIGPGVVDRDLPGATFLTPILLCLPLQLWPWWRYYTASQDLAREIDAYDA